MSEYKEKSPQKQDSKNPSVPPRHDDPSLHVPVKKSKDNPEEEIRKLLEGNK